MTSLPSTVFITGVTGNQGFAVARQLCEQNWIIHATVRNLDSARATELKGLGAVLTKGDWDDEEALRTSIDGCTKLFLCLMSDSMDPDHERRQGESICRIAKAAGVTQVVSSTSLGVSMYGTDARLAPSSLLYALLKVKKEVEEVISAAGFDSVTFLRPAYFMANFLEPIINNYTDIVTEGKWTTSLTADTPLGLIDHEDIARFAVAAFQNPDRLNGREIGLVSEFLTPQQTMDVLGDAMGKKLTAGFLTEGEIAALPWGPIVLVKLEKSMRYMADYVDLEDLKKTAKLTTFKEFLERERKTVKQL
ncbi:NmrA family protein [Lentithecium fluviatile CBS 122367]|uniref:NmrA family protein n=1 Tax=Lentithecium fluviatile CBS 122367 TaxID=1168545 RepID=A0A6G1IZ65_9PLEO|nr:NmrA family protein [Lentithecium fluviatile CBS 122367]